MGGVWARGTPSRVSLFLLLVLAFLAACVSGDIKHSTQSFKKQPSIIHYFEDSDIILVHVKDSGVIWRSADGGMKWHMLNKDDGLPPEEVNDLVLMRDKSQTHAIAIGLRGVHWITKDRGQNWKEFDVGGPPVDKLTGISVHVDDPDKIIMRVIDEKTRTTNMVYTTNGFKTEAKTFQKDIRSALQCMWAKERKEFTTEDKELDKDTILCIIPGEHSNRIEDTRLVSSSNYFKNTEELELDPDKTVHGLTSIVGVQGYLLSAQKTPHSLEMALYVSRNGKNWARALFGNHRVKSGAYTVMESRPYSIQVQVLVSDPENPVGNLYMSNFNGTQFTEVEGYMNEGRSGYGDFENLQNIQGIAIVNVVDNHEDVTGRHGFAVKKVLKSQITFNDGRDFQDLKNKDGDAIHVHNMVDIRNPGRIFSSPAPGLAMAVGNTGKSLKEFSEGDLYVSEDAGESWAKRLDGPHIYEFGNSGAVLVAVYYNPEKPVNKIMYSTDFGHHWKEYELEEEKGPKFIPQMLTTTPDSTSLKFTLMATREDERDGVEHVIYGIDFEGLDLDRCKEDKDFEKWYARADKDKEPGCVMGHKQFFDRRKQDSNCLLDTDFKEPEPDNSDKCPCTRQDFECAFGLTRKDDDCVPTSAFVRPEGVCKDGEKTFEGPPKFRRIPGNDCDLEAGEGLSKKRGVYSCDSDGSSKQPSPGDGKIETTIYSFEDQIVRMLYIERPSTAEKHDETIVVLTERGEVYRSEDQGKKWKRILEDGVKAIIQNPYWPDNVYFLTKDKRVYHSDNRGESIERFDAPQPPNLKDDTVIPLRFHKKNPNWILWTGCGDEKSNKDACNYVASASPKNGLDGSWKPLLKSVQHCEFLWQEGHRNKEELVVCDQHVGEGDSARKQLVSSEDWFDHEPKVHSSDMLKWATMSEFVIVAARDKDDFLKIDASIDGETFAEAHFPPDYSVDHRRSYTVLDSSTHAVFLFVNENEEQQHEFGSILKSNSNGTSYTMSMRQVNSNGDSYTDRDRAGYVDFEKVGSIEGLAVINTVHNVEEVEDGAHKQLKTWITHNDGSAWSQIKAPEKDFDGKAYDCDVNDLEHCSLHLQGYTERPHLDDTYSSPSAIGFMIGVGDVGDHLTKYDEGNMFMSTDGGIEWKSIRKGRHHWEFGDQGSVILMVKQSDFVDKVVYTMDNGNTWNDHTFLNEGKMKVEDLTTVPSDTSRRFVLWGRLESDQKHMVAVNLDFTGMYSRQCKFSKDDKESDYEEFIPIHPNQSDNRKCLFGHQNVYRRKKAEADCFNGQDLLLDKYSVLARNCSCTTEDFECAYNFERQKDGTCGLVPNHTPLDPMQVCQDNPDVWQYFEVSPYRKIPISTCEGGKTLDLAPSHACPHKEVEYRKHHGISSAGLFFSIVIPLTLAGGVGYWLFRNYGDGKLGQIRLGDAGARMQWNQNQLIQLPVMLVSALVAGVMAIPFVVGSVYRSISKRFGRDSGYRGMYSSSRYTSRSSFARRGGGYTSVNADESDLLGEDSDDDV